MNDELKEILDRIETASEIFDCLLKPKECTELLDFITNLQQENDNMEKIIKQNKYKKRILELEEVCSFLQQENERLKETNVYCNRTDCIGRIKNSRKYDSVYQEKEDYKTRCEKALNILNNIFMLDNVTITNNAVEEIDKAINILQGENNE